jgi:hypothetical protein
VQAGTSGLPIARSEGDRTTRMGQEGMKRPRRCTAEDVVGMKDLVLRSTGGDRGSERLRELL